MGYRIRKLSDDISILQETGVANFMRCNIWHVRGRDFDLVIDTGMGLDPLKHRIMQVTDKPIKAIVTHCHFDHSGCLHEFDVRLGHRAEADILASPENSRIVYEGAWTKIAIVDPGQHPGYSAQTFHVRPAPLTGYLDEGDIVDLGDRAFQILHLPGHSPGSIGLWDTRTKTLFSGDALYNGELLDNLYHSDVETYHHTLNRIRSLEPEIVHAGHFPSFGKHKMHELIDRYFAGQMSLTDIETWFAQNQHRMKDIFADQDWEHALKLVRGDIVAEANPDHPG